jgi:thymidine phosphorylase
MAGDRSPGGPHSLRLRRLGIDTYQEPVVFMRSDCPVCRSEGFEAQARVLVRHHGRSVIATVNVVTSDLLSPNEAGLSEAAWRILKAREGHRILLSHSPPLESMGRVRAKVHGRRLDEGAMRSIIQDIAGGRYSDVQLSSFITACAGGRLDRSEMAALTRAMIEAGDRLSWDRAPILDKHGVGGLPGNRTTPIVVPIVAALGLTIPKTSSRAITSPSGTADTMQMLTTVDLDAKQMRRVVEREGGCIVWGSSVRLSPADDILIRVERPLDLDSEGQLVASILSKKAAAGSSHVVIDMPVGPTAKVRSAEAARALAEDLVEVGREVGLVVLVEPTDGVQPVGRGIGPALEARDVLAVLKGEKTAPADLKERALHIAGRLLEISPGVAEGTGARRAREVLDDGRAWRKFEAICEAQGGLKKPRWAAHTSPVGAPRSGVVSSVDNRRLARVAKLAGAPKAGASGVDVHVRLGDRVETGQPLFTVHAAAPGELAYALEYVSAQPEIFSIVEGL